MKGLVLLAALAPLPAQADLYRWVDPQSGSVKFASSPPPWFGDPEREHRHPAVEVIRYGPAPSTTGNSTLASLEARFASLLQLFQAMPRSADFDRIDPSGAARRRAAAQEAGLFDQLRAGLGAQLGTKPPVK